MLELVKMVNIFADLCLFLFFQIVHTAPYLWQPFLNLVEIHNEDSELWQELQSAAAF